MTVDIIEGTCIRVYKRMRTLFTYAINTNTCIEETCRGTLGGALRAEIASQFYDFLVVCWSLVVVVVWS